MDDKSSQLVIDIAGQFLQFAKHTAPDMDEAYLRFYAATGHTRISSIYRDGETTSFFEFSDYEREFDSKVRTKLAELREAMKDITGREFCVCLVRISAAADYNVYFEYEDPEKWTISKENGRSGIPEIDPDR